MEAALATMHTDITRAMGWRGGMSAGTTASAITGRDPETIFPFAINCSARAIFGKMICSMNARLAGQAICHWELSRAMMRVVAVSETICSRAYRPERRSVSLDDR
jgi:fructose-1-phosphate kinase PfkB-like protein